MNVLLLACVMMATPVVVDRVAVNVGTEAITQSEIHEEIAVTAFLNGEKPDYGLKAARVAAERLVDQVLIHKEMALGRYPEAESAVADTMLAEVIKAHGGAAAFHKELGIYGITLEELRAHLRWQASLVRFVEVRFRPAVQVTDSDVQQYFQQHYATKMDHGKPFSLEDLKEPITNQLTGERADEQMEIWLKETRKQVPISFREGAFQTELKP